MALYATLSERLRLLVDEIQKEHPEVSERSLSLDAGQSHGWLAAVMKGNSKDPAAIPLARLCEQYSYSVRWLITGLGPKLVDRRTDDLAARERGEPAPPPRGSPVDELAARTLEGRRKP